MHPLPRYVFFNVLFYSINNNNSPYPRTTDWAKSPLRWTATPEPPTSGDEPDHKRLHLIPFHWSILLQTGAKRVICAHGHSQDVACGEVMRDEASYKDKIDDFILCLDKLILAKTPHFIILVLKYWLNLKKHNSVYNCSQLLVCAAICNGLRYGSTAWISPLIFVWTIEIQIALLESN